MERGGVARAAGSRVLWGAPGRGHYGNTLGGVSWESREATGGASREGGGTNVL